MIDVEGPSSLWAVSSWVGDPRMCKKADRVNLRTKHPSVASASSVCPQIRAPDLLLLSLMDSNL